MRAEQLQKTYENPFPAVVPASDRIGNPGGCGGQTEGDQFPASDQYANGVILVTPGWLDENIDTSYLLIIDMQPSGQYAQAHIPSAHTYFLLRLMGFENVRGCDGSWAEWGNRPDLPVVTGNLPGEAGDTN